MGVVHHSVYPVWFEVGRTEFIRQAGLTYSMLEEAGVLLPLIELSCTYKSFARYEDKLMIKTSVNDMTNTRISFSYEVYRCSQTESDGVLIASGKTFHVFADKGLKPVNMKKHNPEIYEKLNTFFLP